LIVVLSTSRRCSCKPFSGRLIPVTGSRARHNSWTPSSAFRNRLNSATAESSATPAALARTTVSCKEYPRAKCNKSVRISASREGTPRNRLLAPVSPASSRQLLGKRDRRVCQFFSYHVALEKVRMIGGEKSGEQPTGGEYGESYPSGGARGRGRDR